MVKVTLFIAAVALAGCASTRQERAAEFQRQLPQLVASCNALGDERLDATVRLEGATACEQLALNKSLGLADRTAVSAYQRHRAGLEAARASRTWQAAPTAVLAPLPQVQ